MTLEMERGLLATAVALLGVAVGLVVAMRNRKSAEFSAGLAATVVATMCLVAALVGRVFREGQGPFLTLYEVLLSNLASLALIYTVALAIAPVLRPTCIVVLPFLASLGLWALTVPGDAEPLPATFDNPWLWLHVVAGKLFLGLCMVAAATAIVLLLGQLRGRSVAEPGPLDRALWPLFSSAFLCHSFMLVAGAVWAYSAWGRYWAWDPLETWTFLTWLSMAIVLHARATWRRLPGVFVWIAVPVVFALAFLTFFGVPFLSVAPHKGAM